MRNYIWQKFREKLVRLFWLTATSVAGLSVFITTFWLTNNANLSLVIASLGAVCVIIPVLFKEQRDSVVDLHQPTAKRTSLSLGRNKTIRVAILDDHQTALDSYAFRLGVDQKIKIVASATNWIAFSKLIDNSGIDLMILDISVPVSGTEVNPYPILFAVPELVKNRPQLKIIVVSMHNQPTLVNALIQSGASGYILKEDRESITGLSQIVRNIVAGQVYLSPELRTTLYKQRIKPILSAREREALSLLAADPLLSTLSLAKSMNIAPSTLRNILSKVYRKLHVRNKDAAIRKARQLNIITPLYPSLNIQKKPASTAI